MPIRVVILAIRTALRRSPVLQIAGAFGRAQDVTQLLMPAEESRRRADRSDRAARYGRFVNLPQEPVRSITFETAGAG